jgi:hypothetical protein
LLAFQGLERDDSGSFTDETELGADMTAQYQRAVVNIDRMLTEFFTGAVAASKRTKPTNG